MRVNYMKYIVAVVIALVLTGCEQREVYQERRLVVQVDSVYLTSKSNSKVNLRDVATGTLYERNRLSCSRQKASKVELGSRWDVTEVTYIYPESKRYTTELVGTRTICELSN